MSCHTLKAKAIAAYVITDTSGMRLSRHYGPHELASAMARATALPDSSVRPVYLDGSRGAAIAPASSVTQLLQSIGAL